MEDPPTPIEDDEASVPIEYALTGPDDPFLLSAGNRKMAKRTFPFDLTIGETIQLVLPGVERRERKRRRLEEPFSTSTDEATTENTSHDTTVALPPPGVAGVTATADHADNLAALEDPVIDSSIDLVVARTGKWTADEDKILRDAVPAQGRKDWVAISAKVPGRTRQQCHYRWRDTLDSNIDPTTARVGKWTADEGKMLKDAVRAHGAKNWKEIAALVPGRTRIQCHNRWRDTLDSNIDPTTAHVGHWTADEDTKLRDAVPAQGSKNREVIARMIPGRTKKQGNRSSRGQKLNGE
jgi:hypothetical protein